MRSSIHKDKFGFIHNKELVYTIIICVFAMIIIGGIFGLVIFRGIQESTATYYRCIKVEAGYNNDDTLYVSGCD